MEADKLFHIDLNSQKIGRYDQDFRFGAEDIKQAFLLIRLLEGTAGTPRWQGSRHFDAHAYRTEDLDGVWEFARGCMRTYKILKEKAQAFDNDPEVIELISEQTNPEVDGLLGAYSADKASHLKSLQLDVEQLGAKGLHWERLDQVLIEHLLGAR